MPVEEKEVIIEGVGRGGVGGGGGGVNQNNFCCVLCDFDQFFFLEQLYYHY